VIGRANDNHRGGDCARVFFRREDAVMCFLGDVTGHDERAASLARELEMLVSSRADRTTPGVLLSRLNADLESAWRSDVFVSAVCFSFDSRSGRGSVAVAGQLPPLVRTARTTSAIDVIVGPPLGILADQRYRESEFGLRTGDLLVAVTDGITDPLASDLDLLGTAALAELVARTPPEPDEICSSLLGAAGRSGLCDDATVLAIAP
jgi:serine phosphatase RsbU (regulator of sigma subunit)